MFSCAQFILVSCLLLYNEIQAEYSLQQWQLKPVVHRWKTIDEAITEYFENRTKALHVRVQLEHSKLWQRESIMQHLTHLLHTCLTFNPKLTYKIDIQNKEPIRTNQLYYHSLWYVDSIEAFRRVLPNLKKYHCSHSGFYVIMWKAQSSAKYSKYAVQRMLAEMFRLNIVNVVVVVREASSESFAVYTYKVFQPNQCRKVEPFVMARFAKGHFSTKELFPYRFHNFHNCTLRFLSRNVAPFFTYDDTNSTTIALKDTHGIEAELLKIIAEALNFHVEIHIEQAHLWGDVYENGSVTGPYRRLQQQTTDVLFGFFSYTPQRTYYFGESNAFLQMSMVAVVKHYPAHHGVSNSWMFAPFQWTTWLFMLAYFVMATLLVCLANSKRWNFSWLSHTGRATKTKPSSWLEVLGIRIGDDSNDLQRYSIVLWCAGIMVFNAAYQGKLYVGYNYNDNRATITLRDLSMNNYTLLLSHNFDAYELFTVLNIPTYHVVLEHADREHTVYEELLNSSSKVAMLANQWSLLHYIRTHALYEFFDIVPEQVKWRQACAYFEQHSYLIQPFNRVISKLRSSGLVAKLINTIDYNLRSQEHHCRNCGNYARALNVKMFTSIFFCLVALQALATLMFIAELFVHYRNRRTHINQRA